jgi:cobalt-zinc-cadmium resistance protein CzcA
MVGFTANAQTKSLTNVDDAINIALQNNQAIKASDLEIDASKALKKTARELPKLDFNAQLGQYNSTKFDQSFQVSQTIPFPSLFGAKKQLINAEIKGKELQKNLSVLELKNQVRTYYYQILYLQHNQKQLQQLDSLYNDFIKIAQLRYKTGDTKKVDISTAEAKKGEINLLLKQNGVFLSNAVANLKTLMNTKDDFAIAENGNFLPLQISNLLGDEAVANHPAIQSLYQDAVIAEQTKKVERSQGLPDFTIGYVNQSLIGFQNVNGAEKFFNGGNRFNSVNIGIAIPITYGATKARVKSLDYRKQAAEANAQQQQKTLATQMQNALQQYQQDIQQYNYFEKEALPNAKEIVSAAQLGYRTGDIGYVEYLFALQTATDIQLNYLKSIQQVNQSVINIYSFINQ